MSNRRNIAARMGHWSATHHKKAIWGWLAFVIVAFAVGSVIGMKALKPEDAGVGESGRVDKLLGDEFETPATERVMIQSETLKASSPAFKSVIADVVTKRVIGKGPDGYREALLFLSHTGNDAS